MVRDEKVHRDEVIAQIGIRIRQVGVYGTIIVRVSRAEDGRVQAEIAFPAIPGWSTVLVHAEITMPEGKVTGEGSRAVRQMITVDLVKFLRLEEQGLILEIVHRLGSDLKRMPVPDMDAASAHLMSLGPPAPAFLVLIEPLDDYQMPNFF